jgi:hypothetical protein
MDQSLGPLSIILNFYKICRDIHSFLFIIGVVNATVNVLFVGANDTSNKLPQVLLPYLRNFFGWCQQKLHIALDFH